MNLGGFYKTRVYVILLQSPIPLTSKDVWNIFKLQYCKELQHYPGKTKKSSIESVLSRFARSGIISRMIYNNAYQYFLNSKKNRALEYMDMSNLLEEDEKVAINSLMSLNGDVKPLTMKHKRTKRLVEIM